MSGTLVVVEDQRYFARLVCAALEDEYEAVILGSVTEARSFFGESEKLRQVASVVLDLALPDGWSLELVPLVRRRCPDVPIVVLTGHASVAATVDAMKAGASDVLVKTPDMEAIKKAIRGERSGAEMTTTGAMSLDEVQSEHIWRVMHEHGGNVSRSAEALGLHRQSLQRKLRKLSGSQ